MKEPFEQIVVGDYYVQLDRREDRITFIPRDSTDLFPALSPAQLAYVLQQYGEFKVPVGDMSHWRGIYGTTEEG